MRWRDMEKVSIVVPCFNEEDALSIFYTEITKLLDHSAQQFAYELVFIDDGSVDRTLSIIREYSDKDPHVQYISFSRNFGKEAAIYAGLKKASGDYIAVMDVDMQDPPHLIPQMYEAIVIDGYDCVATRRISRKGEPVIRSFFSKNFYRLFNKISKTQINDGARDFRLMTRKMVDSILSLNEVNRFSKGIFSWVGYKTKWLEYENIERSKGNTKWSFWKLFVYSIDGIIAFSTAPLVLSSILGIVSCIFAVGIMVVVILKTLLFGDPVAGYPSLISIITFMGGIQLLSLGILGQYLSKIYLEAKKRPLYIISNESK
jgi:glycosyltransferase involved in cell wall biosynthesis